MERLELPGIDRTNRIARRMAYEWNNVLRPHRTQYRNMVMAVLGDSAWDPIAVILEENNFETARRLDGVRHTVLNQVASDDQLKESLDMQRGKLAPTPLLRDRINRLIDGLHDIVNRSDISEECVTPVRPVTIFQNVHDSTVVIATGNSDVNVDQRVEQHIRSVRDTVEAQPEDSPTFVKVAKKTALDIISGALKDVAKGQVKEAAKQIYELGKDLGPAIARTAAYAYIRNHLGQ
jgi:hypothetical protein